MDSSTDSDTYINTSIVSDNIGVNSIPEKYDENFILLKKDVRLSLNPEFRKTNNISLALPLSWFTFINDNTVLYNIKYHLFPLIDKNTKIINVSYNYNYSYNLTDIGNLDNFNQWQTFFNLPYHIQNYKNDKLLLIKNEILKFLNFIKIFKMPYMLIVSYSPISKTKILQVHHKLKSRTENISRNSKPLFTIQIQDCNNPFVLFWLDTENICSFNLNKIKSPEVAADFANTMLLFTNFAQLFPEFSLRSS